MPVVGLPELCQYFHAVGLQIFRKIIALPGTDGVVLIDMVPARIPVMGQKQIWNIRKGLPVSLCNGLAPDDPGRQMAELDIEKGRLEIIQQTGKSMSMIFPGFTVFISGVLFPGNSSSMGM